MMHALAVATPRYVLLDGKQRIGPKLSASSSEPMCTAIYGFSDKQPYDAFIANCQRALTPYPLVKGYLRTQLAEAGDPVRLVAIDAVSPHDATLQAATMSSILEAQEKQASCVSISYRLILDHAAETYRVEKAVSDTDPTKLEPIES